MSLCPGLTREVVRPAGEPPQKRPRSEQPPESRTVKRSLQFCPIDVALGVDWTADERRKTLKKTSGIFFTMRGEGADILCRKWVQNRSYVYGGLNGECVILSDF